VVKESYSEMEKEKIGLIAILLEKKNKKDNIILGR